MRASQQTRTFSQMINDVIGTDEGSTDTLAGTDALNSIRSKIMPSCPEFSQEEYTVIVSRYAESHIRYSNEGQFWGAFFTISIEGLPRLRAKLKANEAMRNLSPEEALEGDVYETTRKEDIDTLDNLANNPDSEPTTETEEILPYVQQQEHNKASDTITTTEKRTLGKVSGLYFFKHSLGSQAYGEWLDSYRDLFIKILTDDEEPIYKKEAFKI